MKKTILAAACVMVLTTSLASAQSSQGNAGPGTMNNKSTTEGSMSGGMNNNSGMSNSGMSNSTTGTGNSGMAGSGEMAKDKNGMAKNPSSQGNVGPGTTSGSMSK